MNFKKWRLGLAIAIICGLLTAGAGLVGDMNWKGFVAVLCMSLLTNLGNFFKQHPYEDITGLGDTKPAAFTKAPDGTVTSGQ